MKLIIQIPCFNEEDSLPLALKDLPREIEGFDQVEWLIIDDGSVDNTVAVARAQGADHIVRHTRNQGLARAFITGLDACLSLGADVIVNTDADNQYYSGDIPALARPILAGEADIVVGARSIDTIAHFSLVKKLLQKLGSHVVRIASKTEVPDAPSGFRALSREAALRINVFNEYTYTLETIIQAGQKNMAIVAVPVRVNEYHRPSRLVKNIASYIKRSIVTIIRIFVVYQPFRAFMTMGLFLFGFGVLLGVRFLIYVSLGQGEGHVQSVVLAGVLLGMGFQTMLVAFLADLMSVNRKLLEELKYAMRKQSLNNQD